MAGTKRKSVGDTEPEVAPKRARSSLPVSPETTLTEEELNDMSKEELVQHALDLQARLQLPVASIPEPKEMSAEQLAAKVQKAKQMLIRGIEKQMKWTPSCKTGKARFTYEGYFHDERVFKAMLGLPDSHKSKMFKIPVGDFHEKVGHPVGKVRYALLDITSPEVNFRWSPEERTFKVTATYGK